MADRYRTKRGEVRWRARWRTGNGERHSRGGFGTEHEAVAHEEAMRTARRAGTPLRRPTTRMSVDEYWRQWWKDEVTVAKARATQYSYRDTYASHIAPLLGSVRLRQLIDEPRLLSDWRTRLIREKSSSAHDHAHRVLSSMLSAAAEEGVIPHNPLLLLGRQGRRGRSRAIGRRGSMSEPLAVDVTAWFIVLDYLRRPTRPRIGDGPPRPRRYTLDCECDALIVAVGFMAGLRLPSEALGLTRGDVRRGRIAVEGHSSSGEYVAGSKTGRGRDLPMAVELAEEFTRVRRAYRDAGRPLEHDDFWISARQGGAIWSEHQANNWRRREFRPVVRQVALDFPQFRDVGRATPYATRHTFISCCLQAGVSLATVAAWCGTSIQMISATYGRVVRRHEGAPPVPLEEQFRASKVEAVSLLSARSKRLAEVTPGGSSNPSLGPSDGKGGSSAGSLGRKLPVARRQKLAV